MMKLARISLSICRFTFFRNDQVKKSFYLCTIFYLQGDAVYPLLVENRRLFYDILFASNIEKSFGIAHILHTITGKLQAQDRI